LVRVLKNRMTGRAGAACALYFNRVSGRLDEVPFTMDSQTGKMVNTGGPAPSASSADPFAGI